MKWISGYNEEDMGRLGQKQGVRETYQYGVYIKLC